ncbi:hypothetical protein [Nocardia nova]|uniref:hypothetical protein n=1 Tax=Nocardia nova TaxID=37330 RepID=UPI0011B044D2|nr:hypothetical protein [Nocardia nova]
MVAYHPDPAYFLRELGFATLRAELTERGVSAAAASDARSLADFILGDLGFQIPEPLGFSIGEALESASAAASRVQYAQSDEAARGAFDIVIQCIERVLRYSVVAWAQAAGSNNWEGALSNVLAKSREKGFHPDRLALGDWQFLFSELPKHLKDRGSHATVFAAVAKSMRSAKIVETLDGLVARRNDVIHERVGIASLKSHELNSRLFGASTAAVTALQRLDSDRRLPVTVRPIEEIRDSYGRRRLILVDHKRRQTEVFVAKEYELTRPLIYIPSGNSLQDIEPILIASDNVEAVLKLNGR